MLKHLPADIGTAHFPHVRLPYVRHEQQPKSARRVIPRNMFGCKKNRWVLWVEFARIASMCTALFDGANAAQISPPILPIRRSKNNSDVFAVLFGECVCVCVCKRFRLLQRAANRKSFIAYNIIRMQKDSGDSSERKRQAKHCRISGSRTNLPSHFQIDRFEMEST